MSDCNHSPTIRLHVAMQGGPENCPSCLRSRLAEAKKDAECYHHLVGFIRANRTALAGEVLDWFTGETAP